MPTHRHPSRAVIDHVGHQASGAPPLRWRSLLLRRMEEDRWQDGDDNLFVPYLSAVDFAAELAVALLPLLPLPERPPTVVLYLF